jgi:hypothetical protein
MKKNKFTALTFICAVVFAAACSDNDSNPDRRAELIGEWNYVSKEYFGCTSAADNKTLACGANNTYAFCLDINLKSDGTYFFETNAVTPAGTWAVAGSQVMIYGTFKYSISASALILETTTADATSGCKERYTYARK